MSSTQVQELWDFGELDDLEALQSNSEKEEEEEEESEPSHDSDGDGGGPDRDSDATGVDSDRDVTCAHASAGSSHVFDPPPRHPRGHAAAPPGRGTSGAGQTAPDIRSILSQLDEDDDVGHGEHPAKVLGGAVGREADKSSGRLGAAQEGILLGKLDDLFGAPEEDDTDDEGRAVADDNDDDDDDGGEEIAFDADAAAAATQAVLSKSTAAEVSKGREPAEAFNVLEPFQEMFPVPDSRMLQMQGMSMRQRRAERYAAREAAQAPRVVLHAQSTGPLLGTAADLGASGRGPRMERLPGLPTPVSLTWASPWVDPSERSELQPPPRQAPGAPPQEPPAEQHPQFDERASRGADVGAALGMAEDLADEAAWASTFANISGMGLPSNPHAQPGPPAAAAAEKVEEAPKIKFDSPVRCANCCVKTLEGVCCSRCLQTYYCSAGCQQEDWAVHRRTCELPAQLGMDERFVALGMEELRGL